MLQNNILTDDYILFQKIDLTSLLFCTSYLCYRIIYLMMTLFYFRKLTNFSTFLHELFMLQKNILNDDLT